jgi:hypothetical protein
MLKRLIFLLIITITLIVGAEMFLPQTLAKFVTQGLSSNVNSRELSAKLAMRPAIFMLAGRFEHIAMDAVDAKIDKVLVHEIHVSMENVELDMGKLFTERKVAVKKAGDITLVAKITQEDLAKYLNTSVKGIHNATVVITPEKTIVGSQWTIGGLTKIDVRLEGKIVSEREKIKFIPERFLINSSSLNTSSLFGGTLMSEIAVLDSSKLPFGVIVRNIVMQDGQVVINADNKIL